MVHWRAWAAAAVATSAGYAAHRASLGEVRGPESVRRLYDRLAPAYDLGTLMFLPLGAQRLRERAVDLLDLRPGDTVVDLGCGTGANLPILARAVGGAGRVVGVDLSPGMLERARRRADRHRLTQVTLVQGDMRTVRLPVRTSGVLATASLEMVPEHDDVVRHLAAQLASTDARLVVGGFRRPPTWPRWAVAAGRTALAVFGVTRAYESIRPWLSVRRHMDEVAFGTAAGGAVYVIAARPRAMPCAGSSEAPSDRNAASWLPG